jgi:hypothetical protein
MFSELIYDPLDPRSHEIRLLNILPRTHNVNPLLATDSEDGQIVCQLDHVSLDSQPQYIALSYVWGDGGSKSERILLNGKAFGITQSLHDALEYLRSPGAAKVRGSQNATGPLVSPVGRIWVDAICIYQDRYRSKCCRNLRFKPQFCEGVGFTHLACRIGKFTLRVFIMEIYQYIAFYLYLTIPPSRRLARSSSQYDHVSLL